MDQIGRTLTLEKYKLMVTEAAIAQGKRLKEFSKQVHEGAIVKSYAYIDFSYRCKAWSDKQALIELISSLPNDVAIVGFDGRPETDFVRITLSSREFPPTEKPSRLIVREEVKRYIVLEGT